MTWNSTHSNESLVQVLGGHSSLNIYFSYRFHLNRHSNFFHIFGIHDLLLTVYISHDKHFSYLFLLSS